MNNFLVGLAVLVIAIFSALFAVPQFVDWNRYRGVFEEEASRFLGRDVRVGGDVGLRLLPTPSFRLEKIIIADSEAGSGEAFFRAEAVSARLSVAPLLRGVLEANEIDIASPQIHIVPGRKSAAATSAPPAGRLSDRLPFAPRDLALSSVRIRDGVLVVDGADRNERFRLNGIEGELSAPALNGPYRFRGTYGEAAARREIRLTTTETDSDGSVRYKLALKHLDTGATYNLDARASDLAGAMRSEGEFTAEIPLAAFDKSVKPAAADAKKDAAAPAMEVKAAMTADTERLKLANLTVSIEQQGRPQLLAGEAEYSLAAGQLRVDLNSKWLDLDRLSALVVGASKDKGPLIDLLALVTRSAGIGDGRAASALALSVDQASLGQEPVSGLAVKLKAARGLTEISEFRLGLPGGSRADFAGRVTGAGDAARYDGDLSVRGTSLARLLTWATAGGFKLDPARDAPFAVRARLNASADNIRARDLVAEIAGTTGQGEVELGLKQRRTLAVTMEGEQVDLRPLLPASDATTARRNPILSALAAASAAGVQIDNVDSRFRLRAARLLTPDGVFNDAVADLEWLNKTLRIGQLKLDAGEGVSLDIEGTLTDLATAPKGTLRGAVTADTARGIATLASLSAWPAANMPAESLSAAIAPLRMAGTAAIGNAGAVEIVGDGTVANSRTKVRAKFDRGIAQWKAAGLDLSIGLDGPDAERIANAMAGQPASSTSANSPGSRFVLRASGTLADGLASHARIERGAAQASFSGRVTALDPVKASGDLQWNAADGAVLQAMLGELPRLRLDGIATRGTSRLDYATGTIALSRIDGTIDESAITGALTLTRAGERTKVAGSLSVGSLTVAGLLRPWTEPPLRVGAAVLADAAAATNAASRITLGAAWPAANFDLAGAKTEGALDLRARRLEVTSGLALQDAAMRILWQPSKLEVVDLAGRALGGTWAGSFAVDAAAPQNRLTGVVRGSKLRLEQLLADANALPIGTGGFDLMLTSSGKGNALRDMIADLSGTGTLEIVGGAINALSPTAVHVALETAMSGQADGMVQRLKEQLDAAMRRPALSTELKSAKLPIEIAGGIATTRPLSIETPQGRAAAVAKVDLPAATFNGEWRIDRLAPLKSAATTKSPPPPLPSLAVTVAGPLGQLARLPATLDTDALDREITVRKMERDVEELERLRKLDEEKAKEEAARGSLPPPNAPATLTPLNADGTAAPLPPAVDVTATAGQPATNETQAIAPVPAEPVRTRPQPAPQPKPAFRPYTSEEMKKIFGN